MDRILPNGSVVVVENKKVMILGARMTEHGGKEELSYLFVKYPIGYVDEESMGGVFARDIQKVLFEGNEGVTAKKMNKSLMNIYNELEGKSAVEVTQIMNPCNLKRAKKEMENKE